MTVSVMVNMIFDGYFDQIDVIMVTLATGKK